MITLVTCHPYRSGGKYRYLVYCDRTGTRTREQESTETMPEASSAEPEEIPLESSEEDIRSEQMLRLGCAAILILLILAALGSRTSEN
jgi:sortase A